LLRVYLSIVLLAGVAALIFWGMRGDWLTGAQAMISIFVVSCPCALGVSIPLADDLAAAAMERLGVFTRTATLWPRLRRIKRVVFDKTGTLTLERPILENPDTVSELTDDAALALARMTHGSLHPIARSLLEALGTRGQKLLTENEMVPSREFAGLGVSLEVDGTTWSLGRAGWSGSGSSATAAHAAGSELRKNGELVAAFHFSESLRPGTLAMLRRLEGNGLSIHLLSGDHPLKVEKMALALGLPADQAHGGLSPEEKAAAVQKMDHQDTLYLGDGANDSLAFDAAFVTGTPVVDRSLLESKSDFYTLGSGLEFLPRLLNAAASRENAVRAAFAFAIVYNLTTVAFSAAGKMSPLLAAILMPLSSIVSIIIVASLSGNRPLNKG
jgi:Cu2+-exporting ATPase